MPLPLIPVLVVGAVGAGLISTGDQHEVAGAVPHPDVAPPPEPEIRPPRPPLVRPQQAFPVASTPLPPDLPMSVIEAGVGQAAAEVKDEVVGAATLAAGTLYEGGTISEAAAAGIESAGSSFGSAAQGAASAIGPGVVIVADVAMVAGAIFTMFGGDPEDIIGHTYATTPQLDATTPLGQAAARAQAKLIRASLATEPGVKFGFKGEPDPANFIAS